MDDRHLDPDLERLLAEELSTPPPEAVLRAITPWRRAMNGILIGLMLQNLTLNFGGLNYILPAVGVVLILLGLRPLRRENRAFRVWWYGNLLDMGLWAFQLLRRAAPGWQTFEQSAPGRALIGLGLALALLQYLCLWLGLRAVRRNAGLESGAGSALALLLWQAAVAVLALTGLTQIGLAFFAVFLIAYVGIIQCLFRLSRELDEAGYVLRPAPVRVPDWLLGGAVLGTALLGVTAITLTCGGLPMDWQPVDPSEQDAVEDIKADLLRLGFPKDVLADLSAGDVRACGDPLRVVSDVCMFTRTGNVADEAGMALKITNVAVELAGEQERWRIVHHFQWESGTRFFGSEAAQLWPSYRDDGWDSSDPASGRVLCEVNGSTLWSPFHYIGEETYTFTSMFFGEQTSTDLFASFSFPWRGEHCRGYVTFEIVEVQDGWILDSWFNYAHARRPLLYPAISALDWIKTRGIFTDREPFLFVQSAIQFYPFWDEET